MVCSPQYEAIAELDAALERAKYRTLRTRRRRARGRVLDSAPARLTRTKAALLRLHDHHGVAFAVLEEGGLGVAAGHDAVHGLHFRRVVFLEHDAALLELGDFALDVVDQPERLVRLGRAGVWRLVQEA